MSKGGILLPMEPYLKIRTVLYHAVLIKQKKPAKLFLGICTTISQLSYCKPTLFLGINI